MSTDSTPNAGAGPKASYEKPVLEVVDIHSDEVLAAKCKTTNTATGAVGSGTGCSTRACSANGS